MNKERELWLRERQGGIGGSDAAAIIGCNPYKSNVELWKEKLLEKEEMITKKEVKKVLNMRTNAASLFNRFLHEKFGIWIFGEWRKEEFDAIYQIGNLLDIKYEYNDNDYKKNKIQRLPQVSRLRHFAVCTKNTENILEKEREKKEIQEGRMLFCLRNF